MRTLTGIVTSTKMDKTAVVTIDTHMRHPKYKKSYKTSKSYYAHDADNSCVEGQQVTIVESRPLSRLKRWIVTKA